VAWVSSRWLQATSARHAMQVRMARSLPFIVLACAP
jgi:hypothetical protein